MTTEEAIARIDDGAVRLCSRREESALSKTTYPATVCPLLYLLKVLLCGPLLYNYYKAHYYITMTRPIIIRGTSL